MSDLQEIICYCSNVTRGEIVDALNEGAHTLSEVKAATGACTKADCKRLSPRKTCCSPLIAQIIAEYQEAGKISG